MRIGRMGVAVVMAMIVMMVAVAMIVPVVVMPRDGDLHRGIGIERQCRRLGFFGMVLHRLLQTPSQ